MHSAEHTLARSRRWAAALREGQPPIGWSFVRRPALFWPLSAGRPSLGAEAASLAREEVGGRV